MDGTWRSRPSEAVVAAGLDAGAAQRMVDAAGLVVSATCVGLHGGDNSAAYELVAATGAGQIAC